MYFYSLLIFIVALSTLLCLCEHIVTHRGLISTLPLGFFATAAVIISLTDWVLGDVHRRTRLGGKPIPHRRCRSPTVLKIAVRADADSRRNDAASLAIKLV